MDTTAEHFFVMVGQLIDDALIGRIPLVVALAGGDVIEGVPTQPASPASGDDELNDRIRAPHRPGRCDRRTLRCATGDGRRSCIPTAADHVRALAEDATRP